MVDQDERIIDDASQEATRSIDTVSTALEVPKAAHLQRTEIRIYVRSVIIRKADVS